MPLNESLSPKLIDTIIRGLDEARSSNQSLQKQVQALELSVSELKGDMRGVCKDVNQLVMIIRDGNGKEPLVTRMVKVEDKAAEFDKYVMDNQVAKSENIKGKWALKIAVIGGLFGTLGSIVLAILQFLK
jgi:hypothetical protein